MQNHTQIEHKTKEFNIVCLFKKYHIWTQNGHAMKTRVENGNIFYASFYTQN